MAQSEWAESSPSVAWVQPMVCPAGHPRPWSPCWASLCQETTPWARGLFFPLWAWPRRQGCVAPSKDYCKDHPTRRSIYFVFLNSHLFERERDFLFHLCMNSLVSSCTCPDRTKPATLVYQGDTLAKSAPWPGPLFFFFLNYRELIPLYGYIYFLWPLPPTTRHVSYLQKWSSEVLRPMWRGPNSTCKGNHQDFMKPPGTSSSQWTFCFITTENSSVYSAG